MKTVNTDEFYAAFKDAGLGNFTGDGLDALYLYFTEIEKDTGVEYHFNVTAVCEEFTEYASRDDIREYHSGDKFPDIEDFTDVIDIKSTGGVIVRDF